MNDRAGEEISYLMGLIEIIIASIYKEKIIRIPYGVLKVG